MNKTVKRGLSLLLALVMCVAFVPILHFDASAANVNYTYDGNYIYNWGTRGTAATFLSPNAEAFYTAGNTYEELSAKSGGTSTTNAPTSALYTALQNLMKSAHRYETSYDATKNLYKYTDCQNGGGQISSFYSGASIGPGWGEGGSWNREHTWPNSKGLGGNDENDIMMLRPTASSENSSRGNTGYGKSGGYYNPNSESGGQYDLRGDVARIFLYVYVRWGNVNGNGSYDTWGTRGVMESVDVMLEWMEADPVDTWELGRNDSVQSITGTRNVFVDYPELAFLLFGEEVPAEMTTPSGIASKKCDHNNFDSGVPTLATCTTGGYVLYTCQTAGCGYSYKGNVVAALGHSYTDGVCTVCGAAKPAEPTYATALVTGKAYKLGLFSTAGNSEYYFTGKMNDYYGATSTKYEDGVDVYAEQTAGGYRIYFMNGTNKQYINLVIKDSYRNFTFDTTATSVYTWDSARSSLYTTLDGEKCYIGTYGTYSTMGVLRESKISSTDYFARFYSTDHTSGGSGSEGGVCTHNYVKTVTPPTCMAPGFTTNTCSICNDTYVSDNVAAKGHSYTDGTCTVCGAAKPTDTKLTITFDNASKRTVFNTSQQVWTENGITVTNNKNSSPNDVANFCDPVRFYMQSEVIIAYPGMTKIEINCVGLEAKHVNSWLSVTGATATNTDGIITVEFAAPVNSFTYPSLAAQSRAYSITVYVTAPCQHTNTRVEGDLAATCMGDGYSGNTRCLDCGKIIKYGAAIPAGHTKIPHEAKAPTCTEVGWEAYESCAKCDYSTMVVLKASGHDLGGWTVAVNPTCTESGSEIKKCKNCDHTLSIPLLPVGHTDADKNNLCDTCGAQISASGAVNPSENAESKKRRTVVITVVSVAGTAAVSAGAVWFFIRKRRR